MIDNLLKMQKMHLYILCVLAGLLYCLGISVSTFLNHNLATIGFVLFLMFLLFVNLKQASPLKVIIIQSMLLNLSIVIMAQILKSPDSFFWTADSISTHLPEAIKFSDFLKGNFSNIHELGLREGRTTHAITGIFIYAFGINTFATVLVELFFKIIILFTIYKIGQELWNNRIGVMAANLYALCPTVFFYNLVLYKECLVQLLVALIILFSIKIFINRSYLYVVPLIISFIVLAGERYYLNYLLITMYAFLPLYFPVFKNKKAKITYLISLALLMSYIIYFDKIDIHGKLIQIEKYRAHYSSFSDVLNAYNYDIPLYVAFIKILFSPYFTLNKFTIFQNTSLLLIWGSFLNQIIILTSIIGLVKASKKTTLHLILWLPFLLFLLFAAYISPWSGRLRDSFYPLIACYCAYFLSTNKYAIKYLNIKDSDKI